jgi:mono/diheme cytochrome c family protein
MRILFTIAALALVSGCVSSKDDATGTERGQVIAESRCGACHATGRAGESPAPEAPPFRQLSRNYRVSTLEEALAEGISVGHPAMPQFEFPPEDVDALIAYLQSIQEQPGP